MSGKSWHTFRGHEHRINTISFNQDSTVLASGSYDKMVKLWDCKGRGHQPIQTLSDSSDSISSLVIQDNQIFVGSIDGKLRSYDLRMGTVTTDHICQPITSVAISYDSNCLLVSSLDGIIRLFDKLTGQLLAEYKGHTNKTYKIESCLNNNETYVVSGSEDSVIYFWSLVDTNIVHRLKGHSKEVMSVVFHPSDLCLLSASTDSTIKVWK